MTLCAEHACGKRGHVRRGHQQCTVIDCRTINGMSSLSPSPSPLQSSPTSLHQDINININRTINPEIINFDFDETTTSVTTTTTTTTSLTWNDKNVDDSFHPLLPALIGIILVTIIFMSIAGNLLVCIAISTDRNLRKLSNLFLVSLAVADLFVATLVMTFALANDLIGHWIFGDSFCNVWIAFDVMGSTSSILNLCAISLDRYLHIRDPLRYSRWMTKSVVLTFIVAIWLTSCLVSFLPISQGLHLPPETTETVINNINNINNDTSGTISLPSCAMDLSPTYAVVSSSISFFLPCCVMVAFYTRLYMYARMHVKNIKAMTRPLNQLNYIDNDPIIDTDVNRPLAKGTTAGGSPGLESGTGSRLNSHGSQSGVVTSGGSTLTGQQSSSTGHVSEHKAAVTLGIIMGTFLICWVPFFVINITAAFCKTCISELCFKILTWLGYANSALNPIIYSIFNQEFRRAFGRTLSRLYGHKCFCLRYLCGPRSADSDRFRSRDDLQFCTNGTKNKNKQKSRPTSATYHLHQKPKIKIKMNKKNENVIKTSHVQSNGKQHLVTADTDTGNRVSGSACLKDSSI